MKKSDREVEAAKLHGQFTELGSRFDERGEKFKEATSEVGGKTKEVKEYQAAMPRAKDELIEERDRIAE